MTVGLDSMVVFIRIIRGKDRSQWFSSGSETPVERNDPEIRSISKRVKNVTRLEDEKRNKISINK